LNAFDPGRDRQVPAESEELHSGVISVREVEGMWRIECRGHKFGAYATQESALWDAVATAMQARAAGRTARVDLQEGTSTRTIWPKPPAAQA
jgi:hypothetical protein